jgi:hypothetical protein
MEALKATLLLIIIIIINNGAKFFVYAFLPQSHRLSAQSPQLQACPFRMRETNRMIIKTVNPTMSPPTIQLII